MVLTLASLSVGTAPGSAQIANTLLSLSGEAKPRRALTIEANFDPGSGGGTSIDAYVQTTLDGGTTWIDIANFHFTTSAAKRVFSLSATTPVTSIATPSDGTLSSNTAVDGILGDGLRVKWSQVGNYTGTASLTVTAVPK